MFQETPASKNSLAKRRLVQGKGTNDSTYNIEIFIDNIQYVCPYYKTWKHMIERCYSNSVHKKSPTYIGCSVCESWLTFSNFRAWMEIQDWKGKQLDKDILVAGNKLYSPETCIFVSSQVNSLLNTNLNQQGLYATGVYFNKEKRKYAAFCRKEGKKHFLGYFSLEEEAINAYKTYKKGVILQIANEQTNLKIKQRLIEIAVNY